MSTMVGGHGGNAHYARKALRRVVLGTAAVLLVPLLAMGFTREVNWTGLDFVAAAVLLLGAGAALEAILYKLPGTRQRLLGLGLLGLGFLYVWAELAVGVFFWLGS